MAAAPVFDTGEHDSHRLLADGAQVIQQAKRLAERHGPLKRSTFALLRWCRGIRGAADALAVCALCSWPVEFWQPAAKHEDHRVHAACLDERAARTRSGEGYGLCPVCDHELIVGTPVGFHQGKILHLDCWVAHRAAPAATDPRPRKPGARAGERNPQAPTSARGA